MSSVAVAARPGHPGLSAAARRAARALGLCGALAACAPARPSASELVAMDADDVVALARDDGRPVVVSLWASWCEPCLAELPALAAFQAAHPEAVVLGLTTDDPDAPADAARLRKVLSDRRPAFALARVVPGGEGAFLAAFGRRWDGMLPKLLVLGPDGALRAALDGEVGAERLAREVAPALGGPR